MLNICYDFANSRHLVFNAAKSFAIHFGLGTPPKRTISMGGSSINWVSSGIHLGITLHKFLDDSLHVTSVIHDLYARANSILSLFCFNKDAMFYLFRSCCTSLYGIPCCRLSCSGFSALFVAWNKMVCKLFRLPFRTHCLFLPRIVNVEHFEVTVRMRMLKFVSTCIMSENVLVKKLACSFYADNRSIIGCNVGRILWECNIDVVSFPFHVKMRVNQLRSILCRNYDLSPDHEWRIGFILDLLDNPSLECPSDMRRILLDYLCCS